MKKLEIGQILYSLDSNNAAKHSPQVLTPVKVTKIGRKYFTTGFGYLKCRYYLNDWRKKTDNACSDSKLYESEQAYLDEKEMLRICEKISENFKYGRNWIKLSLDALHKIEWIIKEGGGG